MADQPTGYHGLHHLRDVPPLGDHQEPEPVEDENATALDASLYCKNDADLLWTVLSLCISGELHVYLQCLASPWH